MPNILQYRGGSVIYFRGDAADKIYIVQKGSVRVTHQNMETGSDEHDILQAGECFGVKSALGRYNREESVVTVGNSVIMAMSVGEFEQFAMTNTRIVMKILKVFSNQLRRIHRQLASLMVKEELPGPEAGLFGAGAYYLKNKRYAQARYVFSRYLFLYPEGGKSAEAAKGLEAAETPLAQNGQPAAAPPPPVAPASPPPQGETAGDYAHAADLLVQGMYPQAYVALRKIVDAGADQEYVVKGVFDIGRCLFQMEKYDNCIRHFTQVITKYSGHPDFGDALFFIGRSYERTGREEQAAVFYKKILSMAAGEENGIYLKAKQALKTLGTTAPDFSAFGRFARVFRPDEMIFSEHEPGDTFYMIQSGRVRLVKIIGDFEKTLDILEPSDTFGEMAILENSPRSAAAIAVDEVTVLEFNRQNFELLLAGNPQVAFMLLKVFAKRIFNSKRKFMILTLEDPQAKIADVFLMLNESQMNLDRSAERRVFKTTADDIAHWAGMDVNKTREILDRFVQQRRVELFPDTIVIKNINDFSRFVGTRRRQ
jgi:CRP-like cAMP-binding protein